MRNFDQGWLVTNIRFPTDAVRHVGCVGPRMIGWDHPVKGDLTAQVP
jgi:hypothetical protein